MQQLEHTHSLEEDSGRGECRLWLEVAQVLWMAHRSGELEQEQGHRRSRELESWSWKKKWATESLKEVLGSYFIVDDIAWASFV